GTLQEVFQQLYVPHFGPKLFGVKVFIALCRLCPLSIPGDVSGEVLVDIGSGPTLYQVLSACEVFNKVLLTDFLEVNRQELRRWLQDEGGCNMDWTPYLQHVCKLEGRRPSAWMEKAAKLRQAIADILPVDVHSPQPLAPDALPSGGADCLVSCFCLESVSPDLPAFTRALGHIGRLLRPSGHLLLIGALGESYYFGGPGVKIPVVPLNEGQVCDSLKESGFTLIRHFWSFSLEVLFKRNAKNPLTNFLSVVIF
uniref:Phenylethanolamine N-methyltransferase n=1 Tax=Echeneis naucrates TaxID=173247 RepID=A0A665TGP1_ECHNA